MSDRSKAELRRLGKSSSYESMSSEYTRQELPSFTNAELQEEIPLHYYGPLWTALEQHDSQFNDGLAQNPGFPVFEEINFSAALLEVFQFYTSDEGTVDGASMTFAGLSQHLQRVQNLHDVVFEHYTNPVYADVLLSLSTDLRTSVMYFYDQQKKDLLGALNDIFGRLLPRPVSHGAITTN